MLSVGALAFLNPLFLIGLAALPLLWLLLRATPPSPKRVAFPAVRVLLGLDDRERTPSRTPWWLLLLRCLAIAALLLAFAQPVLNPIARLTGSGPVLVLFDGGWSSAADWEARRAAALDVLSQAADAERPAAALSLADAGPAPERLLFGSADAAAERAAALTPAPWGPDPRRLDAALTAWAAGGSDAPLEIVWLHGGLDAPGAEETAGRLAALGSLKMIGPGETPLALGPPVIKEGVLHAVALRADAAAPRGVTVAAFGATGDGAALGAASGAAGRPAERRLAQAEAGFAEGETRVEIPIELPLELQNGLSALRVPNAGHAGATALLDDRWGRRAVALVSGEQELDGQPLLSGMHYLRAALAPHATFRETTLAAALGRPDAPAAAGGGAGRIGGVDLGGAGVGGAIRGADPAEAAAAAWADVIILADVGRMDWETEEALTAWVESGGLLIRFAGPKLAAVAAETDRLGGPAEGGGLLPTPLRGGGRALGGALSWSTPQGLRPFPEASPFFGLDASREVSVSRQVLAQPGPTLNDKVWAALDDGTPLVTASGAGAGRIVLFHVTAGAGWSSLPLSGLFVEMMGRLVTAAPALAARQAALAEDAGVWAPERLMDASGRLRDAPEGAAPVTGATLANGVAPGIAPGIYAGAAADGSEARLALSALGPEDVLAPRPPAPAGAASETLSGTGETDLKPYLLATGLSLLILDILAALAIAGRLAGGGGAGRAAAMLALAALGGAALAVGPAHAASPGAPTRLAQAETGAAPAADAEAAAANETRRIDPAERRGALETVLAFVETGDAAVDRMSAAGLLGLSATLYSRTAIEPGEAAGVNLETDEIAVYAVIYWPITATQEALSPRAVRKLNAFMRTGGLLLVDTRDAHQTFGANEGPNTPHLRRLLQGLDLPSLEPIPSDHVLTRSFYLLDELPGRWRGGVVWVARGAGGRATPGEPTGSANDGVSPIVIGGHDWASAWAIDDDGANLAPMGRGGERQREFAYRFGVNLAMYAYTGNYKSDQVHIPALLERLGN